MLQSASAVTPKATTVRQLEGTHTVMPAVAKPRAQRHDCLWIHTLRTVQGSCAAG